MNTTKIATFGAGCFWGVEDIFMQVPGVIRTASGYMGGDTAHPSYEDVCTDETGHAEVVEIQFDPSVVSYERLVEIFWKNHNPTEMNKQGPDVGTQYRSVIFTHSPEQERIAHRSKEALEKSGKWQLPIATAITPATTFWRAEDDHQQYFKKKGIARTCHL